MLACRRSPHPPTTSPHQRSSGTPTATGPIKFLTIAYKNILGRVSDQAGFDYWLAELRSGLRRASGALHRQEHQLRGQHPYPKPGGVDFSGRLSDQVINTKNYDVAQTSRTPDWLTPSSSTPASSAPTSPERR
ncbi:MAG: DUF4214 domain-containing protein [Acidimicrobiales bacterium]